jgi:hypothetical protein
MNNHESNQSCLDLSVIKHRVVLLWVISLIVISDGFTGDLW